MSQPQKEPAFISTGEVTRRLGGISRSTLQNMFDHIPHLSITEVETRLFPTTYINAYAVYLQRTRRQATVDTAASFWRTREAQRLYAKAVTRLEAGLSSQVLTPRELSALLGTSYSTIMGWRQRGLLQGLRQAISWKTPIARREPVPPTLRSMFMSTGDVNAAARKQRRDLDSTAQFGQLQTPGGGRVMPIVYVQALFMGTTGPLNEAGVLAFNATGSARAAMATARGEFDRRLTGRREVSLFKGLLVLDDVAWLLGMTRRMIDTWCVEGQLPHVQESDRKLIRPDELQARCKWILPTRR